METVKYCGEHINKISHEIKSSKEKEKNKIKAETSIRRIGTKIK